MFRPSKPVLACIAAAVISLAACRQHAAPRGAIDLETVEQLGAGDVSRLSLQKVDSVMLGTADETVGRITDMAVSGGRYYVLDATARNVRVFDRGGRLVRTIGRPGSGPGEFRDPTSLTLVANELLVADLHSGISRFDTAGRFLGRTQSSIPPSSLAGTGGVVGAMRLLDIVDPRRQGQTAARMFRVSGDSIGAGCVADQRYEASRKVNGRIAQFTFGALTAGGGEFYCTQGITPVVQVMDSVGTPLRQIRLAPPFYVAPQDGQEVTSQQDILQFLGSFTAHSRFVPVRGGFVSHYTRYSEARGEVRSSLFACRDGARPRCGTVEDIGLPVHIAALDTVYIEEEAQADQPVQIGIYHVTGLPR